MLNGGRGPLASIASLGNTSGVHALIIEMERVTRSLQKDFQNRARIGAGVHRHESAQAECTSEFDSFRKAESKLNR
jgi:hypothetical protein